MVNLPNASIFNLHRWASPHKIILLLLQVSMALFSILSIREPKIYKQSAQALVSGNSILYVFITQTHRQHRYPVKRWPLESSSTCRCVVLSLEEQRYSFILSHTKAWEVPLSKDLDSVKTRFLAWTHKRISEIASIKQSCGLLKDAFP